jgi:hypothetical protein
MSDVTIKARVRVVLDVDVSDVWGGDCPMSQVEKQARESAVGLLARVFGAATGESQDARPADIARISIAAVPEVECVVTRKVRP